MTELTPFFELLRKAFIVVGMIGALEVVALISIVLYLMSRPYVRNRKKERYGG